VGDLVVSSPEQLRHDAETAEELKQGPFANDFRWAANDIERLTLERDLLRAAMVTIIYATVGAGSDGAQFVERIAREALAESSPAEALENGNG
jgi:hypothetical protein